MVDVLMLVVLLGVAAAVVRVFLSLDDQKNSRDAMTTAINDLKISVDKLQESALTLTAAQQEARKDDANRRRQAALDEISRQAHYSQF